MLSRSSLLLGYTKPSLDQALPLKPLHLQAVEIDRCAEMALRAAPAAGGSTWDDPRVEEPLPEPGPSAQEAEDSAGAYISRLDADLSADRE
jgi:hypothetical protein